MTRVILNQAFSEQLAGYSQPVELCDPSGRTVGTLFPAVDVSMYEPWEPTFAEEELRETEKSTDWRGTEQLLKYLENLNVPGPLVESRGAEPRGGLAPGGFGVAKSNHIGDLSNRHQPRSESRQLG